MHAFVTGATGFIGSNLVNELVRQNYSVSCLVRSHAKAVHLQNKNIELVLGDLNAPDSYREQIKKADIVFHVAGVVKAIQKSDFSSGNLETTRQLVHTISQHAPIHQKLIYISSQAAAGPCAQKPGINELAPDSLPVSAYGQSKYDAEKVVLSISDTNHVVILRPSIVFGPRDHGMKPLFKTTSYGIMIKSGFRDFPVSLIYVDDLINAILLAAKSEKANGKTFYVTDGNSYSWDTLLKTIATHTNLRAITLTIPLPVIWIACKLGGLLGRLLRNPQDLNPDKWLEIKQTGWLCNSYRIQDELGFRPQWTLENGIKETITWYRKTGWL
jgi:nucleoside-diphosphate-sugar epimerase